MDGTRLGIVAAILALLAAIGLWGAPMVMLTWAERQVDAHGCTGDEAPSDAFFEALDMMDRVASFPGFAQRSLDASSEAASTCLSHYTASCSALRDAAVDQARAALAAAMSPEGSERGAQVPVDNESWRAYLDAAERDALCTRWSTWADWLTAHGLEPGPACAVCAPDPR